MNGRKQRELFTVNADSQVPKYRQIIDGVIGAIREKRARRGDILPSASYLCDEFQLARETVIKAYSALKKKGVVRAVPRRGYFVATESVEHTTRVLLLFDELSPYKQDLYDSFRRHAGSSVVVDIFFHHCDIRAFKALLLDRAGSYNLYAVMPFEHKAIPGILEKLDRSKLLMLDRADHVRPEDSFIGQDHDESLFDALDSAADLFEKYTKACLVMPEPMGIAMHSSHAPSVIPAAFRRFCAKHRLNCSVERRVGKVRKGEAWFVIDDADLVAVVEQARENKLKLGKDLGVLAYNETAMRKIAGEGITVVSTDFKEMGRLVAEYVLNPRKMRITVPTRIIRRRSL